MKKKKSKKALTVFLVLFIFIVGIGAAAFLTVDHYLSKIGRVDDEIVTVAPENEDFETDENSGLPVMEPEEVDWGKKYGVGLGDEKLLNILLVGQDRRPGEGRARSDAMIVVSVNTDTRQVSMVSFLRDLYVQIPGYTDNRMNAAYAFGGFPLLKNTLYTNFGVTVDGCFEVDFNGFVALIDAVGGVDITLTEAESQRIGRGTSEGLNHLDGYGALAYARIRKIGTDFARTDRQRTVLMAAYQQVKNKSFTELTQLLNTVLPYITTDLSNAEIYAMALRVFPMITSVSISSYRVPPEGMYTDVYIRQMEVLYPNLPAIREKLKNEYFPF